MTVHYTIYSLHTMKALLALQCCILTSVQQCKRLGRAWGWGYLCSSNCCNLPGIISTTNVSLWAEPWPSWHDTVAPERSVDAMVVMVEVRGDFDVRLKVYTVPWLVLGLKRLPMESLAKNDTLLISWPLKKSISQDRTVVFTTHVKMTFVPGQLYALPARRVAVPTVQVNIRMIMKHAYGECNSRQYCLT